MVPGYVKGRKGVYHRHGKGEDKIQARCSLVILRRGVIKHKTLAIVLHYQEKREVNGKAKGDVCSVRGNPYVELFYWNRLDK